MKDARDIVAEELKKHRNFYLKLVRKNMVDLIINVISKI